MHKVRKTLSEHWIAFVFAFLVGSAIILPTIISIEKIGRNNFKGIYPTFNDDESHYMTMIKEVGDGHIWMGNPYVKELKNTPYTQPFLADVYYFGFAKIFRISIQESAAVNDFFLPFLSFLLLYSFIFRLFKSKKIALSFSVLFFVLFLSLFNRPVNPQFSFVFLLLGLHLIWLIVDIKNPINKAIKYNFLLSIVFGVLVYIYPFYWMTLIVLYGGLSLGNLWFNRDFIYWLKNWGSFLVPAFLFSTPFLINLYKLTSSPLFSETNIRNGYVKTHIPGAFLSVAPLFLCIPVLYLLQKSSIKDGSWEEKKVIFLGWILIFGGIFLNWQNIFTGEALQFTAHLFPVSVLFVCIIGALSFTNIKEKNNSLIYRYSIWFFLVLSIGSIIYIQKDYVIVAVKNIYNPQDISYIQRLADPLEWLNLNTIPDSTVYALGDVFGKNITTYTHNNIYFDRSAGIFLMSDDELENRWIIEHFFDDIKESDIYANSDIWLDKYIDTYQSKEVRLKILNYITGRTFEKPILQDQDSVHRVLEKYYQFKKEGFEKALKTYEVDYILLDLKDAKHKTLEDKLRSYPFLTLLIKTDSFEIFRVN